jgi:hypothetical protein
MASCECVWSNNLHEPRVWLCDGKRVGSNLVPPEVQKAARCREPAVTEIAHPVGTVTCDERAGITYWYSDGVEVPEDHVPADKRHVRCTRSGAPPGAVKGGGGGVKGGGKVSPKKAAKPPQKTASQLAAEQKRLKEEDESSGMAEFYQERRAEEARKAAQKPAKKGILTKVKEAVVSVGRKISPKKAPASGTPKAKASPPKAKASSPKTAKA